MRTPNALEYQKAAEREIQAFIDNDVFELVPLESAKGNKRQIDCFLAEIVANCGVLVFRVDRTEKETST